MSLKLNVGICQKIAPADSGSPGASRTIEIALDLSLIFNDVVGFHIRVNQASCGPESSGQSAYAANAEIWSIELSIVSSLKGQCPYGRHDADRP